MVQPLTVEDNYPLERTSQRTFHRRPWNASMHITLRHCICSYWGHKSQNTQCHVQYVHTFILRVDSIFEKCSRPKVYQLDASSGHVYEDIFILDVTVDNTLRLTVFGGLQNLPNNREKEEEVTSHVLGRGSDITCTRKRK